MLLKSTTRHVRIFTAEVVDTELQFHPNKLTLDLDPDNEFIWKEDSLKSINDKFNELIKERAGKDLDDYELRKIGSDIEGLIKILLQNGQLSYNPDCRVMNYSMGLPKTNEVLLIDHPQIEGQEEAQIEVIIHQIQKTGIRMGKEAIDCLHLLNKINEKFNELIKERAGKDLDDYELRKIGSEIEGLIKFLLQMVSLAITLIVE